MRGLCTDLYEIRMAASYLRHGMVAPATFSLFVRRLPPERGFLVSAGIADCLDVIEGYSFDDDQLEYLGDTVGLPASDLQALRGLRFTGDVWAVPEGRVVFAGEPLLEVTAPIAQAQLVETMLLNLVTFQTAIATKAARCRIAAGSAELIDFAARRVHGLDAALAVARCSAIAGFAATSYVEAARRFGLVAAGTMAHSYVEAFRDEREAFEAFVRDFPGGAVLLADTYDTEAGVREAIRVALDMGLRELAGVRLDSGDLCALSSRARRLLDEAGLGSSRIVASGGLDEYRIAQLVASGAPIDAYGVGTRMGVSADAPFLDSAYKLVEYDGQPTMKLSPGKQTAPGAKQVFRLHSEPGDLLALRSEPAPPGHEPLLTPAILGGRRVGPPLPAAQLVREARARFERDLAWLPAAARRLHEPVPVPVRSSELLAELTERLRTAMPVRQPVPEAVRPGRPPEDFRRTLRLRDGRAARVDPLTPADAPELAEAIRNADPETLYRRFCGAPPRVTPRLLRHLTKLDYVRRFALAARDPATGRGIAVARYEATEQPGVADVAVVVDPAWRRVGLATALVRMLAEAAVTSGIHRFTATYLASNQAVTELLDDVHGRRVIAHGLADAAVSLDAGVGAGETFGGTDPVPVPLRAAGAGRAGWAMRSVGEGPGVR